MCFECRILGALANGVPASDAAEGRESLVKPELEGLGDLDFAPSVAEVEDKELRDEDAETYLKDTLTALRDNFGVELVPVKVDSDGSCLPHAISRCLVGKEVLYDALRLALTHELREHAAFYREILGAGMDEETFATFWLGIIDEAKPVHGALTGRWLGPEHILGLANVLRRPILLLDCPKLMAQDDNRCGLYLPLRHGREACVRAEGLGEVASPLVIGWANEAKNHFVSLVAPSHNRLLASEEEEWTSRARTAAPSLWLKIDQLVEELRSKSSSEHVEITIPHDKGPGDVCVLQDPDSGEEILVQIPPGKGPGDSFLWNPNVDHGATRLYGSLVHFYATNPPMSRARAGRTLHLVLKNLVDALMVDPDKLEQRSRLRLGNKMIFRNIVCVSGAVEVLRAVGFADFVEPRSGDKFLRFEGDLSREEVRESLVLARDALAFILEDKSAVRGAGEISLAAGASVLGPVPAFCLRDEAGEPVRAWDAYAAYTFGHDPARGAGSGAWVFGLGNQLRISRSRMVTSLMGALKDRYRDLAAGTAFADMPWDDAFLYGERLKHVECPACDREQQWEGPIDGVGAELRSQACSFCGHELEVGLTAQRQMSAFVHGRLAPAEP
ncbi:Tumor necrosis factor alpha-induced protein 3 [Hondaea fermentalgiana]|uniref:Tumor necrosis factor alpha-induced protein 3 n=1 Tax=Hondaea fermentalgiana TaxID=2315210 RepID=A0A2R5GF30_9STRA|nr:Tumor necrosis factor alpha-induced protein 3 [Hondaea fermentalgiana]|eukprot:GBG29530.1 Tumor necrosis factor alpha-induced protein 3 [Hondaea fermentalgiana]